MANNVPITPGSGATVATDQLATGEHVQIMKLMDGTEDGTARIGGDAANGLDVDVTRVQGTVTVDTELTTADLDTGAGTDIRGAVGILLGASGGSQIAPGDSTNGMKVQLSAAPAASRTTDSIGVSHQTDAIMLGLTALTPKFAVISASSSGNNTLVAAVSTKKIRVLALSITCNAAVNAKFQSAASGTDISGLYYLSANSGFVLPFCPVGWFETAASALLNLSLSAGIPVGGSLTYVEV